MIKQTPRYSCGSHSLQIFNKKKTMLIKLKLNAELKCWKWRIKCLYKLATEK